MKSQATLTVVHVVHESTNTLYEFEYEFMEFPCIALDGQVLKRSFFVLEVIASGKYMVK